MINYVNSFSAVFYTEENNFTKPTPVKKHTDIKGEGE